MTSTFKLPKRTATLEFDGTDYDGAIVKVNLSLSISQYLDVVKFKEITEETLEPVFEFIASVLVEWNLVDDDGPIPTTKDGIMKRVTDLTFIKAFVEAWIGAATGVTGPLELQSLNGNSSPAALDLMAQLSQSH